MLYMIKLSDEVKITLGKDATKLAAYGEELIAGNKQKKCKQQKQGVQLELKIKDQSWVDECSRQIKLIYPVNKTNIKI